MNQEPQVTKHIAEGRLTPTSLDGSHEHISLTPHGNEPTTQAPDFTRDTPLVDVAPALQKKIGDLSPQDIYVTPEKVATEKSNPEDTTDAESLWAKHKRKIIATAAAVAVGVTGGIIGDAISGSGKPKANPVIVTTPGMNNSSASHHAPLPKNTPTSLPVSQSETSSTTDLQPTPMDATSPEGLMQQFAQNQNCLYGEYLTDSVRDNCALDIFGSSLADAGPLGALYQQEMDNMEQYWNTYPGAPVDISFTVTDSRTDASGNMVITATRHQFNAADTDQVYTFEKGEIPDSPSPVWVLWQQEPVGQ